MTARFRAIVSDFQHGAPEVEQEILGDVASVESLDVTAEEQMWGRADDADAIMVYHTIKITRATIERLTRCKLIVRCGVGYDNVDYQFARSRGIPVANVPDYGTEEVADSAIGLTLSRMSVVENSATLVGTLSHPRTNGTLFLIQTVKNAAK